MASYIVANYPPEKIDARAEAEAVFAEHRDELAADIAEALAERTPKEGKRGGTLQCLLRTVRAASASHSGRQFILAAASACDRSGALFRGTAPRFHMN